MARGSAYFSDPPFAFLSFPRALILHFCAFCLVCVVLELRKCMSAVVATDAAAGDVLAGGLSRQVAAAGKARLITAAPAVLKTWREQSGKNHLSNKIKEKVIAS